MINLIYTHMALKSAKYALLNDKDINVYLKKIEKQFRNKKGYHDLNVQKIYNSIIILMKEENFYRKLRMINELNGMINYV